ncbi:MAG: forkhead-associated protein [uncultured bacterium]|nr:MAG: forkhead-associated protein [uncultured bacterium]
MKKVIIKINVGDITGKQIFHLDKVLNIGRDSKNDIIIPSLGVSRNHAKITTNEKGEYYLEDMGSHNGTLLNGRLARKELLQNNDVISIADVEMSFLLVDEDIKEPDTKQQADTDMKALENDSTAFIDLSELNKEQMKKLRDEKPSITDPWKD